MKKVVSIIIAVIILMSLNSSTFAETISGRGFENASYTFYAEATGDNATIYFKQTKAPAVLNYVNFWTDEWGCYHIYYTYNGTTYSTEWNNVRWNADNETFSLDLPYKGVYKIQIVAYSAEEINDLYAVTHFTCWVVPVIGGTGPEWWVENCYNCWVSNSPIQDPNSVSNKMVYVDVMYKDDRGNILDTDKTALYTMTTNTVIPGRSFSGYSLISSQRVTVTIDGHGNSSPSTIEFIYQKNYTPESDPPAPVTNDLYGLAIQKLATRYGPSTSYAEGGTFEVKGQYIKVLARSYDNANGIWWVKCEIPDGGTTRVLWTGYKRFDSSTLPLNSIPIK